MDQNRTERSPDNSSRIGRRNRETTGGTTNQDTNRSNDQVRRQEEERGQEAHLAGSQDTPGNAQQTERTGNRSWRNLGHRAFATIRRTPEVRRLFGRERGFEGPPGRGPLTPELMRQREQMRQQQPESLNRPGSSAYGEQQQPLSPEAEQRINTLMEAIQNEPDMHPIEGDEKRDLRETLRAQARQGESGINRIVGSISDQDNTLTAYAENVSPVEMFPAHYGENPNQDRPHLQESGREQDRITDPSTQENTSLPIKIRGISPGTGSSREQIVATPSDQPHVSSGTIPETSPPPPYSSSSLEGGANASRPLERTAPILPQLDTNIANNSGPANENTGAMSPPPDYDTLTPLAQRSTSSSAGVNPVHAQEVPSSPQEPEATERRQSENSEG